MIIVILIYLEVVYLAFFKLKWLPWNRVTQFATLLIGIIVLTLFMVGLRNITPASTQATITARIVEIAPQVSGRVDSVTAERNVRVEAGTPLFSIDPTLYQSRVDNLEATLGLQRMRLKQFQELASANAGSQFQEQQSEATVRQLEAQLAGAQFDLDNTVVRAPTNGMAPRVFLKEGMQVGPSKSVLSFVDTDELVIGGLFPQNALRNIKIGDTAWVSFPVLPGHLFETKVIVIPHAIGDAQIAASGSLQTTQRQYMTKVYPVYVAMPDELPEHFDRVGLAALVYIHSSETGVIQNMVKPVAKIMQMIKSSLDAIL